MPPEGLVDDDHSKTVSGFWPGGPGKFSKTLSTCKRQSDSLTCSQSKDTSSRLDRSFIHTRLDLKLGSDTLWNHDIRRGWWRVGWGCWAICHWHHLELGNVICESSACVKERKKKAWIKGKWEYMLMKKWMITHSHACRLQHEGENCTHNVSGYVIACKHMCLCVLFHDRAGLNT